MEHTKGEWKAEGLKVTCFGAGIVLKAILPQDGGCINAMGNSQIAAASPNMLYVLEKFDELSHFTGTPQEYQRLIKEAFVLNKAAINKAKGIKTK